MNVLDLIRSFRGEQQPAQAPQAPQQGSQFLEGLLNGSLSGAPAGFNPTHPNVMGMEGSKYYPEFRFGYSGSPALERLGVTQPGGFPPGMAMQLAKSQYFAPGSGQGVNMAGNRAPQAPAPAGPPGGQWVNWADGMGRYFSPFQTKPGESVADAYFARMMGSGSPGGEGGGGDGGASAGAAGGGGSGCLAPDTLVLMADNTLRRIDQIKLGDEVSHGGRVLAVMQFEADEWFDVRGVRATGEHAFLTDDGWQRAEDCGRPVESAGSVSWNLITESHRVVLAADGGHVLAADYIEHDPHGPVFDGQNDRALAALNGSPV
ncbi:MAG: Hint domain-containing protein [Phycisphaerae bacterium]|jgi:hypothetical protein